MFEIKFKEVSGLCQVTVINGKAEETVPLLMEYYQLENFQVMLDKLVFDENTTFNLFKMTVAGCIRYAMKKKASVS